MILKKRKKMLNEEKIREAFSEFDDAQIENIKYIEDKDFWAVDCIAQYGFNIEELSRFVELLELNPAWVFIDSGCSIGSDKYRLSLFEQ